MKRKKYQCKDHPEFETNSKPEFIQHIKAEHPEVNL